jgi:glycosyltransferase involved in cell wall biosynthesis
MTAHADRIHVLLLRDAPAQRFRSMERLADELERGIAARPGLRMTSMTVHESAIAARFGLRRLDSYTARFLRYPLMAARRRADVYHVVDHGYAHVAALLPRARTVISCHDLMLMRAAEGAAGFRPGLVSLARFRWSTSFLRRAARVVVPGEATRRDVVRLRGVDPRRVAVVPYGIDECFRPADAETRARLKRGITAQQYAVLHVSTGGPYKNVPGTLRVLAALRAQRLDVALVRAGHPLREDERRLAARLGVSAAVVECGHVPDARLVELYQACDVLLFPSFLEGYGWPPLEAMACGTPAVTSDCPALLEVAGEAALAAPATDVGALAAAVRAVLESPGLAERMRRRGLAHAARYTWRAMAAAFARVYEDVALEAADAVSSREARACAE